MNITDLATNLRVYFPSSPAKATNQAVLDAAREFCTQSTIWRVDYSVAVTAGDTSFNVVIPAESALLAVVDVGITQNGQTLPVDYMVDPVGLTVTFTGPIPMSGNAECVLVLEPSHDATSIADVITDKWRDGILNGAIERMYRSPIFPEHDFNKADYYRNEFHRVVAQAKEQLFDAYAMADMRLEPTRGFGI